MYCNKEEKGKNVLSPDVGDEHERPVKHLQEDVVKTLTHPGLFHAPHSVWNFIILFYSLNPACFYKNLFQKANCTAVN